MEKMSKREFLAAGIGAGAILGAARQAWAQEAGDAGKSARPSGNRQVPTRRVKTTKLFKSPDGFPNAIAVTEEGLWIGEQKETGQGAARYACRIRRT